MNWPGYSLLTESRCSHLMRHACRKMLGSEGPTGSITRTEQMFLGQPLSLA